MLNPAEPPVMMRNTVHVMVDAEEVDEAAITDSIQAMVERVQQYVPGYTLKSRPLFDRNRVSILLEVTGAGDYLPTYAGNLDIMTAVAVRSGKTWQVEVGKAALKRGKLAVLHIPGIGIKEDLQQARAHGAQMARICTHCTEADICEQHMRLSKQMGMEVVGFLMLAHMLDPRGLVEQARKMESYGADVVVLADSAGGYDAG